MIAKRRKGTTVCFPTVLVAVGKMSVHRNAKRTAKSLIPSVLGKPPRVIYGPASGPLGSSRQPHPGRGASARAWEAVPPSRLAWGACGRRVGVVGVRRRPPVGEGTVLTVTAQREGRAAAAEGAVFGGRLGRPLTGGQREGGRGVEQHQADSHDIP